MPIPVVIDGVTYQVPVTGDDYGATTTSLLQTLALRVGETKISSADTSPDILESKLIAGDGIILTKNNPGANETISVSINNTAYVSISVDAAFYSSTVNLVSTTDTIDGYTVVSGSKVLVIRTTATTQDNKIYVASGSAGSWTWTIQSLYAQGTSQTPTQGDTVYIKNGNVSGGLTYTYNGVGFGIPGYVTFTLDGPAYVATALKTTAVAGYRYLRRAYAKSTTTVLTSDLVIPIKVAGTTIVTLTIPTSGTAVADSPTLDSTARITGVLDDITFDIEGTFTAGGSPLRITLSFI